MSGLPEKLALEVVTPEGLLLREEVDEVVAPGADGYFGVLTLPVKIQKAVDCYTKKYERKPDLCLVHPSMLEKDQTRLEINKLSVRPYRPVLPGHIWIGIEDKD